MNIEQISLSIFETQTQTFETTFGYFGFFQTENCFIRLNRFFNELYLKLILNENQRAN